jgi:ferredoxin
MICSACQEVCDFQALEFKPDEAVYADLMAQ